MMGVNEQDPSDAVVAVMVVVSLKELRAESTRIFERAEAIWKVRAVLEGLEVRF